MLSLEYNGQSNAQDLQPCCSSASVRLGVRTGKGNHGEPAVLDLLSLSLLEVALGEACTKQGPCLVMVSFKHLPECNGNHQIAVQPWEMQAGQMSKAHWPPAKIRGTLTEGVEDAAGVAPADDRSHSSSLHLSVADGKTAPDTCS